MDFLRIHIFVNGRMNPVWPKALRVVVGASALLMVSMSFAQDAKPGLLPRRGMLGIRFAATTAEEAKAIRHDRALKVGAVLPKLTGEALGIQPGDLLDKFNGALISDASDIGKTLSSLAGGADIAIEVVRDGKPITLRGKLVEKPRQAPDGFEVVYDQVVSRGKRIRMIATHPSGAGPFPTVFLIGGIGAYSVDGDFATAPYGTIMGPIAKSGYATIRIDKPGQGDSEGPAYPELRFDDELDAYLQALRKAKTFSFVDKGRIAIFGHSMGGAFGPLLDAQEKVAGIAVSGTIAKTWVEYQLENTRRQSLLAGASAKEVDTEMKEMSALCHHLFNEGESIDEIIQKYPKLATAAKGMSPDGKTISGVGVPFFQELAKKNLVEAWSKTDAAVLTLWGENDFVSTQWDHEFIAKIINARKPKQARYQLVPKSDHGFFETTSMEDSLAKWGKPGSKFNPNVIDYLKEWLKETLGTSAK